MIEFEKLLTDLLNRHNMESASGTPDYILAQYLIGCLCAFNLAVQQREACQGRDPNPMRIVTGICDESEVTNA